MVVFPFYEHAKSSIKIVKENYADGNNIKNFQIKQYFNDFHNPTEINRTHRTKGKKYSITLQQMLV